jgi:hypothetical protein
MKAFDVANVGGRIVPFTSYNFSFPVTVDQAGADDAVAWVDEWHWYLHESRSTPFFQLARNDTLPTTRSGRVTLSLTAAGAAAHVTHDAATMDRMLRGAYLFAITTGGEIFTCDLHGAAFASAAQ